MLQLTSLQNYMFQSFPFVSIENNLLVQMYSLEESVIRCLLYQPDSLKTLRSVWKLYLDI